MGGSGTALACEAASIVLLDENLLRLPQTVRHARRTRAVVRANICISVGAKIIAGSLALFGLLPLAMAAGMDLGATLLVLAVGCVTLRDDIWRDERAGAPSERQTSTHADAELLNSSLDSTTEKSVPPSSELRAWLLRRIHELNLSMHTGDQYHY
mmetsp:Transcript_5681/g.13582  ORF Transcript_5681/g.13582 Transcript_5681/m.13582 type:complete len:155 (+) Transcript_5681:683-1147(+)